MYSSKTVRLQLKGDCKIMTKITTRVTHNCDVIKTSTRSLTLAFEFGYLNVYAYEKNSLGSLSWKFKNIKEVKDLRDALSEMILVMEETTIR